MGTILRGWYCKNEHQRAIQPRFKYQESSQSAKVNDKEPKKIPFKWDFCSRHVVTAAYNNNNKKTANQQAETKKKLQTICLRTLQIKCYYFSYHKMYAMAGDFLNQQNGWRKIICVGKFTVPLKCANVIR